MAQEDFFRLRGQRVVETLVKNEFEAVYYDTKEEAAEAVLERIPENIKVGIGGSMTIRDLALAERIKQKGCRVYDLFEKDLTKEEVSAVRREHITSDLFLTGINALTLKGQLVNIDNTGNRVAAMIFGPKKVIAIVGINKIVTDLEAAHDRIKNYTVPRLACHLNAKVPCAESTFCRNCSFPQSICRITTVINAKPNSTESFLIVVVGETLGF